VIQDFRKSDFQPHFIDERTVEFGKYCMAGVLTVLAALAAVILTSRSLKNADHSTPAWEPRAKSLMRSDFEVALS